MSSTVRNEQIKLTANLMNGVASGIVLVGLVTPLVGSGLGTLPIEDTWNLMGLGLLGFVAALVIHSFARRMLTNLED